MYNIVWGQYFLEKCLKIIDNTSLIDVFSTRISAVENVMDAINSNSRLVLMSNINASKSNASLS